jgi:hypothetical protein
VDLQPAIRQRSPIRLGGVRKPGAIFHARHSSSAWADDPPAPPFSYFFGYFESAATRIRNASRRLCAMAPSELPDAISGVSPRVSSSIVHRPSGNVAPVITIDSIHQRMSIDKELPN